jgi:hypothetical protein
MGLDNIYKNGRVYGAVVRRTEPAVPMDFCFTCFYFGLQFTWGFTYHNFSEVKDWFQRMGDRGTMWDRNLCYPWPEVFCSTEIIAVVPLITCCFALLLIF